MTREILTSVNIALDIYSTVICFIILYIISLKRNKFDVIDSWFRLTIVMAVGMCVTDIFTWVAEGNDAMWKLTALPLSNFLYFVFGIFIFLFYIRYSIQYYKAVTQVHKGFWYFCEAVCAVYLLFALLTPDFGFYYTISEENHYIRGAFFWLAIALQAVLYVELIIIVIKYHSKVPGKESLGFLAFVIIPLITELIQVFNFGIALNCTGITISFLIVFLNHNKRLQITLRMNEAELKKRSDELESKERAFNEFQMDNVITLSNMVEKRDSDTGYHVKRTRDYVEALAKKCIFDNVYPETINNSYLKLLTTAAPLHDIGKIIVSDSILKKPGKLTAEEFDEIKKHSAEGGRIIYEVFGGLKDKDFLNVASEIATGHHEKWNGTGYPAHLEKENIPVSARIMAIADVFDALVSKRCYKDSMSYEQAFDIIKQDAGSHFDPLLAEEFLKIKDEVIQINERYKKLELESSIH